MTGVTVRETVTLCRTGRAGAAGPSARRRGYSALGTPCGDGAVLLELFGVTWFELSHG